ncbi:MAG TPA: hypothetical protein VGI83_08245 [Gemmatimonadales bacterium]
MPRNIAFAGLCATLVGHALAAQECQGIRGSRAGALAGTYVATETAVIAFRPADWWQGPVRSFQFNWVAAGGSPSANQDYLLHMTASYEASQAAALAWEWACASPMTAAWLGAATAFAVGLPKKIGDGFHDSGFEGSKNLANAVGALLPVARQAWPASRGINLKGWYWPSPEFRQRTPGGEPHLLSDYAGQRYFLTFSPGLLPGGSGAWPRWLGAGVGHGTPAWITAPAIDDWYVVLDLNWRGLPIKADWWRHVASLLDQVHLPLPGLRRRDNRFTIGLY